MFFHIPDCVRMAVLFVGDHLVLMVAPAGQLKSA